MTKLLERLPDQLTPKVVAAVVTGGFAAAGLASITARNLRTIADRDTPLADRLRTVGQTSIGAVLSGPSGLVDAGRDVVTGRQGRTPTTPPAETPAPAKAAKEAPPRAVDTSQPNAEVDAPAEPAPEAPQTPEEPRPASEAASDDDPTDDGPFDLRADLEQMTVAQLRDRAAQDGIPGRSKMNKDELVAALTERETSDA